MLTLHPVLIHLGLTTTLGNGVLDSPISERKNEAHDHGRSWRDADLTEQGQQDYSTWPPTDVTTPAVRKQQCCSGSDLAVLPEPSSLCPPYPPWHPAHSQLLSNRSDHSIFPMKIFEGSQYK